jgi:hypothetical protein
MRIRSGTGGSKRPDEAKADPARWIAVGVALGAAIGVAIGTALENIAIGIGVGIPVGLAVGMALMRSEKAKQRDK